MLFRKQSPSATPELTKASRLERVGLTSRPRRLIAAGIAIAVVGLTVLSVSLAGGASASTTSSALGWRSGAWLQNDNPSVAAAFGAWRGHPLNVVDDWSNRATWQDIVNPTWLYQKWAGSPYTMSFGVAMLPSSVPGVSLEACAAGSYNSYWKQFGSVISSYGLGNSIIRLGWEFNGNWYPWTATNPTTWVKCWQQIVTAARSTAPNLQWNWNVNRGVSAGLADPTQAYPGNAYVDMIGVDSYDWWPAATTASGWNQQLNQPQGLNYWLSFAEAHGKKLAVPEWGSVSTSNSSGAGGDDPAYVGDMKSFFTTNASNLAYEANLQGIPSSTGGSYWPATTMTKTAAAYQAAF
jgi:Glycosyl hydrolase family 26